MSSSIHQAKRPYAGTHSQSHNQSTITSYFHSPASGTSTSPHTPIRSSAQDSAPPPSTPLLPTSVQSNLLNVGMRVRKSVPEGYKTGTFSGLALFSDNNSTRRNAPARDPSTMAPPRRYGGARKELTPFCGIMKVGGLAQQAHTADIDDDDDDEVPEEDDVPFLSSQGSVFSDASVQPPATPSGHKRRLSEDAEGAGLETIMGEQGTWTEDGLSPKSRPVGFGQPWDGRIENRALARPRSRRAKALPFQARGGGVEGLENAMAMDFEDADFLDYQALAGDEVVMHDI